MEPDEKCPVNLGFVAPRRPLPSWSLREEGADAPDIMPNRRTQQRLRPWFIRPGRMLSLLAMAVCCRVAWCGEPSRNEPAPDGDRLVCGLGLTVWVSKPSEELRLAAASLGLPVDWRTSAGDRLSSAALARRDVAHHVPPDRLRGSDCGEGYEVAPDASGSLLLAASSQHGLANGLYDARRALLAADAEGLVSARLLVPGEHKPCFARRETYQFLTTWNLPRLTGGTFTVEQWRTHLRRMRALNVNHFYFDTWADQYYHPDYPETHGNRAVYERMRAACDYAHRLGLRTGVYLFPCQVPPSVYLAHPEAQAVEAINYHGINMCPSRAWNTVVAFDTYLLRYFGPAVDDVVVEFQDPGSCLCKDCCRHFSKLVLRFLDTYRKIEGAPADRRIDLCTLHFRDWLETPEVQSRVAFPIKDLRARVLDALPPGTALFDIDGPTLDMGLPRKLKRVYFFFDLDPESGMEGEQVFPRVKLRRIESQVKQSVENRYDGVMAYRTMPFCQYVADYALFRKCWDPQLDLDKVMIELAAEWGIPAPRRLQFVKAVRDLDAWWEEKSLAALKEADSLFRELAADARCSEFLVDQRDLVTVLTLIGDFWFHHKADVRRDDFYPPADLVERIYRSMLRRRIFEAYTVHQHWEGRARETIGQRLRWWLRAM